MKTSCKCLFYNRIKYLLILLFILSSCASSFENKIVKQIARQCETNTNCIIALNELTDFSWDTVYVFKSTATLEEINTALKFNYPYYKEFSKIIVFIDNQQIVYHEEISSNIESLENKEVVFNYDNSLHYKSYSQEEAIFKVIKRPFEKGTYYELNSI